MRAARRARAIAAGLVLTALAGCGLQQGIGSGTSNAGGDPSRAPVLTGAMLDGARFSWAQVQGHPIVIDFWASWCGPCRAEQADINTLYRRYAPRGVRFVGVDMRDDTASANAFRQAYAVQYQSISDSDEQLSSTYNVIAPPTIVVVGQQGRIVDRSLGTVVGLSDDLDRLLR